MHFTTQFSATTMSLLWGYPFFVRGEGRSPATAGLLLTLMVVGDHGLRAGARAGSSALTRGTARRWC